MELVFFEIFAPIKIHEILDDDSDAGEVPVPERLLVVDSAGLGDILEVLGAHIALVLESDLLNNFLV